MTTKKNNTLQIVIDDGVKEIQLNNLYGQKICSVHFRPADYSIIDRYNEFVESLKTIIEPLEKLGISNNGEAEFEEGWAVLKKAEAEVVEGFGRLFDMDDASEIFAKRNAFSSVNGSFFCEIVLEALGDIIVKTINEETEKTKKKVEKYTS